VVSHRLQSAERGRSFGRQELAGVDPKPSFRLTRRCSIRELALADEASEPHHTPAYGAATDCKTASGYSNPNFGGIDFGHT
jgi:hypothetical protein